MDEEYYQIYREMYETYSLPGLPGPFFSYRGRFLRNSRRQGELRSAVTKIKGAIDGYAETRDGFGIRPDAKYFLIVNFVQVILVPIIAARDSMSTDQLLEDAAADIKVVLDEAAKGSDEREMSSHDIIQSINNVWYQLKLTDALLWMR